MCQQEQAFRYCKSNPTKFNGATPTTLYADYDANQAYPKPTGDGDYCVLTKDEWQYLFANQYWGFATVNLTVGGSVNGLVICPNTVTTVAEANAVDLTGTVYKSSDTQPSKTSSYYENIISQVDIDDNGLLFLPAAGNRNGAGAPEHVGTYGFYWSDTSSSANQACRLYFSNSYFNVTGISNRYGGFSVRLASVVSE